MKNGSWILVKDGDYLGYFGDGWNVLVNKSTEHALRSKYREVKYIVSIRLESWDPVNGVEPGEALAYLTTREVFNRVRIGDVVEALVSRTEKAAIIYAHPLPRVSNNLNQLNRILQDID